jgi:hypothetical protein
MQLSYSLNNNISSEKLSADINKLIDKFVQDNGNDDLLLCVEIKKITSTTNSLIPKLEYKKTEVDQK